jgi:hypothetical protein
MEQASVRTVNAPELALRSGRRFRVATLISPRAVLVLSLAVFLLAKAAWIFLPTMTMGQPRLGDDSLVYLWVGAGNVLEPKVDDPAIRDIIELRKTLTGGDHETEYLRARTTMRTANVSDSPVSFLLSGLLKLGLSDKMAFAVFEMIVACVLATGIVSLFLATVGVVPAATALVCLAAIILPVQGLQYFVPSILTLSLGLILWAELARPRPRLALVVFLAMAASLIHQIALVYISVAAGYVVAQALMRPRSLRVSAASIAAIAGGMGAAKLIDFVVGKQIALTAGTGGVSLSEIPVNLLAMLRSIGEILSTSPFLWVLAIVGLIIHLRTRDSRLPTLFALTVAAAFAGTAFNIPGYPGDLPTRLAVASTVLAAGFAGVALDAALKKPRAYQIGAVALLALHVVSQSALSYAGYWRNLNRRMEVYDTAAIRRDLAMLPPDASVVWTDPDVTMMAAFLEGGTRFRALPFPMAETGDNLDRVLAEWRPDHIAASVPTKMNTKSAYRMRSFAPRFYGLSLRDARDVKINVAPSTDRIFIRFSRPLAAGEITFGLQSADGACPAADYRKAGPDGNWVEVDLSKCPKAKAVEVNATGDELAIVGLQSQTPRPRVNWPWGETVTISGRFVHGRRGPIDLKFDWTTLLGETLASKLVDRSPAATLSDESGIVWVRSPLRTDG